MYRNRFLVVQVSISRWVTNWAVQLTIDRFPVSSGLSAPKFHRDRERRILELSYEYWGCHTSTYGFYAKMSAKLVFLSFLGYRHFGEIEPDFKMFHTSDNVTHDV